MRNLSSIHPVLRFLGVIGLFLVIYNNNAETDSVFIAVNYRLYIVIISALMIGLGLFLKLKFAEEEPSTLTYVTTFIAFLVALSISGFLLIDSFM